MMVQELIAFITQKTGRYLEQTDLRGGLGRGRRTLRNCCNQCHQSDTMETETGKTNRGICVDCDWTGISIHVGCFMIEGNRPIAEDDGGRAAQGIERWQLCMVFWPSESIFIGNPGRNRPVWTAFSFYQCKAAGLTCGH